MAITRNKKGIFFTLISIVLVSSLVFFYISKNSHSLEDDSKVIETRVLTMNSLIKDIEHDISRGLYISSMRSLIGMTEFLAKNGSFIDDFSSSFNEIMINGTIYGIELNITKNASFGNWTNKIIEIAERLDVDVGFKDMRIVPYQDSPWNVKFDFLAIINLTDKRGLAAWQRNMNITTELSIIDFEDPLYTIKSSGKLTNKIISSNITDFVSGGDAANLIDHANHSRYIASEKAPSFLMRFSGNLSNSTNGIESIINVEELQLAAPEIYKSSSSSVDYIYLGNLSISNCKVNETKLSLSWLRLDDAHLDIYEANCESW